MKLRCHQSNQLIIHIFDNQSNQFVNMSSTKQALGVTQSFVSSATIAKEEKWSEEMEQRSDDGSLESSSLRICGGSPGSSLGECADGNGENSCSVARADSKSSSGDSGISGEKLSNSLDSDESFEMTILEANVCVKDRSEDGDGSGSVAVEYAVNKSWVNSRNCRDKNGLNVDWGAVNNSKTDESIVIANQIVAIRSNNGDDNGGEVVKENAEGKRRK